ncbi:hypothetical protein Tco_1090212 [Tanacetum coccineum]|uniref:Uncharacterized protein n=1 Tax=Tanacetum coccineum TaxID=301880 RepID=A0ABQ5I4U1_9ASTR
MSNKHKDWLVQEQTALGKDFSNPLMADNLPKIVWLSTHHICANSSTQNPPRKAPRTDFIDLSSNESSSIQNIPLSTTLDTTLALTIPPPTISQTIPSQGTNISPLVPRAIVFSTPPSSPLEPHPYLTTLDDLPPRNSNPPPPSLSQGHSQGLSQTLPIPIPMDFEASFPPINLSRTRMCAQPKPFLSKNQVMQQL